MHVSKRLEELRKTIEAEPDLTKRFEIYSKETTSIQSEFVAANDMPGVKSFVAEMRRQAPIFGGLVAGEQKGKTAAG
jgi:hypothetical protein